MNVEEILKLAGAAVAAFSASYAALGRQIKEGLKEQGQSTSAVQATLQATLEGVQRQLDELKDAVRRLEERAAHSVNDEEFSAYTKHTSEAVAKLSEKVGRATGAIEAWYQRENLRPR